jgi:hypothetical protein
VLFASVFVAFITQACGSSSSKPPIELAQDMPTLLYFFTEN